MGQFLNTPQWFWLNQSRIVLPHLLLSGLLFFFDAVRPSSVGGNLRAPAHGYNLHAREQLALVHAASPKDHLGSAQCRARAFHGRDLLEY